MRKPESFIRKTPFFYGWVIVGCTMSANFAKQGSSVAVLSIFAIPMCATFNWSMAEFSGAVTVGGLLGALISPKVGVIADRGGARQILVVGSLVIGLSLILLSQTQSLIWFYVAYCLGRMAFVGPFQIAVTSAVANWFIYLRGRAMSLAALAHSLGLAVFPVIAFAVIEFWDWRLGWLVIGVFVLLVGVLPNLILMVQRPEDIGLRPYTNIEDRVSNTLDERDYFDPERSFTRGEAVRTQTFWLLVAFSAFIFPVQAGVSLHQAPHLIDRGISMGYAAAAVSAFSLMSAIGGLVFGQLEARFGAMKSLLVAAVLMSIGAGIMLVVFDVWTAFLASCVFGAGIGGLLTLLPVAWANSFGRQNLGAIRGVTLPVQIIAQAVGPLMSGSLVDVTGDYEVSLILFTFFGICASTLVLVAVRQCGSKNR